MVYMRHVIMSLLGLAMVLPGTGCRGCRRGANGISDEEMYELSAPDDQPTAMATLRKRLIAASERRKMVFLEAYHWTPRDYRPGVEAYYRYLDSSGFRFLPIPDIYRFPGWRKMVRDYAAAPWERTQQEDRVRFTTETLVVHEDWARYRIAGDEALEFYLVPSKSGWRCAPELAYKDPDAYYEYYYRLSGLFSKLYGMVSPQVGSVEEIIAVMDEIRKLPPRKEFVRQQRNHEALQALLKTESGVPQ